MRVVNSNAHMATSSVASRVALAVLLALVATAGASQITFYEVIGCTGNSLTIVGCGQCYDLSFMGGYDFVYSDNQPVTFYYSTGCSDQAFTLDKSDSACSGGLKFFRSFKIACSTAEATVAE